MGWGGSGLEIYPADNTRLKVTNLLEAHVLILSTSYFVPAGAQEAVNVKSSRNVVLFSVLAVALCFASSAKANQVSIKLTGISGGVQGGVATSPYYATVGGVANVPIVCDDYIHTVHIGQSWTANVSTFANLSGVRFWQGTQAATLQLYDEAGYLFNQLFSHPSQSGNISFAMWAIFYPTQVKSSAGWTAGAAAWLYAAQHQTYFAGEFSNLEILTPLTTGPTSPQEYLTFIPTPEPSALLLVVIGLFALLIVKTKRVWALTQD